MQAPRTTLLQRSTCQPACLRVGIKQQLAQGCCCAPLQGWVLMLPDGRRQRVAHACK